MEKKSTSRSEDKNQSGNKHLPGQGSNGLPRK